MEKRGIKEWIIRLVVAGVFLPINEKMINKIIGKKKC